MDEYYLEHLGKKLNKSENKVLDLDTSGYEELLLSNKFNNIQLNNYYPTSIF